MNSLRKLWRAHGTKLLGNATTVLSAALVVGLFDERYDKYLAFVIMLLGGGIVKRGFTNAKNAP